MNYNVCSTALTLCYDFETFPKTEATFWCCEVLPQMICYEFSKVLNLRRLLLHHHKDYQQAKPSYEGYHGTAWTCRLSDRRMRKEKNDIDKTKLCPAALSCKEEGLNGMMKGTSVTTVNTWVGGCFNTL